MKELAIVAIVLMYLILIGFQHLLNWGYRDNDDKFPIVLVITGQLISFLGFYGLALLLIENF